MPHGYTPARHPGETPKHVSHGLFLAFRDSSLSGSGPKRDELPSIRAGHGYTRGSTFDQDLAIQRAALRATSYGVVRAETASGSRRDRRTELQVLLDFVQFGDTLVVTRIDRLARSMKDLQDIVHGPTKHGVALRVTEQPVEYGHDRWRGVPGHAGRIRRVQDQPAPRAPIRRHQGCQSEGRLQRPQSHDQRGRAATPARRGEARSCCHCASARHRTGQRQPCARESESASVSGVGAWTPWQLCRFSKSAYTDNPRSFNSRNELLCSCTNALLRLVRTQPAATPG